LNEELIVHDSRAARRKKCISILLIVCAITAVALAVAAFVHAFNRSSGMSPQERSELANLIRATLNKSANPCDDFYEFACGGWISNQTIPDDHNSVGTGFSVISDRNEVLMKMIAKENHPIIGPYFKSCLNTTRIDEVSTASFLQTLYNPFIAAADGDVWKMAANLSRIGIDSLVSVGITVDAKDTKKQVLDIGQGLLSIRGPDFYKNQNITSAFLKYVTFVAENMPRSPGTDPRALAESIVDFETKAAEMWTPLSQLQDPLSTYNKYTLEELKETFPLISWTKFLSGLVPDLKYVEYVLVDVPGNLLNSSRLLSQQTPEFLQNYITFKTFTSMANFLPSTVRHAYFDFFGRAISGAKAQPQREIQCVRYIDSFFGDEIGKYYVEKAFPGESKTKALEIVQDLKTAFGNNLPSVDWMDDVTRAKAKAKLSQITDLIGYPDKWTDYSSVIVNENDFFTSSLNARIFAAKNSWARLQKPSDKTIWQMTPPTVNAYYDPTFNTINFPAGILQPGFFKDNYPSYINFGGLGAVAGHEISHGFDSQGRKFDGTGKLTDWWTETSARQFETRAQCLKDQYSEYVIAGLHVNGEQTINENIADNSGIKTAFAALKLYEERHGKDKRILEEFTNEQMFFISYGQTWCAKSRPEYLRFLLLADVHSPNSVRVLAPLINFDEFGKTFECPVGSRMNPAPEKKCKLW